MPCPVTKPRNIRPAEGTGDEACVHLTSGNKESPSFFTQVTEWQLGNFPCQSRTCFSPKHCAQRLRHSQDQGQADPTSTPRSHSPTCNDCSQLTYLCVCCLELLLMQNQLPRTDSQLLLPISPLTHSPSLYMDVIK